MNTNCTNEPTATLTLTLTLTITLTLTDFLARYFTMLYITWLADARYLFHYRNKRKRQKKTEIFACGNLNLNVNLNLNYNVNLNRFPGALLYIAIYYLAR